ncbi:hypothetical protein EDD85DRAFT_797669 [Armillaria nabsnona]|nr:hypothetical protein EDD85DRAFT_797669 [Armillaria nabsnona]
MPLTDDEKKVVEPFFGEFKQYQVGGTFIDFWPKVHKAYFDVFPPPAGVSEEVQAEALAKKENSMLWFFYNKQRHLRRKEVVTQSHQVAVGSTSKGRKHGLTPLEAYIKHFVMPNKSFHEAVMKLRVEGEVQVSRKLLPGKIMNIRKALGLKLFQREPEEVRKQVLKLVEESKASTAQAKMEVQAPVDPAILSPEDIYQAVDNLPHTLNDILKHHDISLLRSIKFGEQTEGLSFMDSYPAFYNAVVEPFIDYVHQSISLNEHVARMSGQNVSVPVQSLPNSELKTAPAPPLPIAAEPAKAVSAAGRIGKIAGAKNVAAFVAAKILLELPGKGGNVQDILAAITASSASRSQGSPLPEDTASTLHWDFDFATMFLTDDNAPSPSTNVGIANVSAPACGGLDFSAFRQGNPSIDVLSAPHVESILDEFLSTLDIAPGWQLPNETMFKFDTSSEFDDIGGTRIYGHDKDSINTGNNGSHEVVGLDFSLVSAPPSADGLHIQASSTSTPSSGDFDAVRSDLNVDDLLMSVLLWPSLSATATATVIPLVVTEVNDRLPERQDCMLLVDQGQNENVQKEPALTDQESVKHSENAVPSDELEEPEGDQHPVRQCKVIQHPDGPIWRQQTETELLSDDLGDKWHACIDQLPTKERPSVLSTWLLSKNCAHYTLSNWSKEDADQFAEDMVTWWRSVQPKWRKTDSGLPLPDYSHDLSVLRKGGKLGISNILLGLRWWGLLDPDLPVWKAMVDDVSRCLQQLKGGNARRQIAEELAKVASVNARAQNRLSGLVYICALRWNSKMVRGKLQWNEKSEWSLRSGEVRDEKCAEGKRERIRDESMILGNIWAEEEGWRKFQIMSRGWSKKGKLQGWEGHGARDKWRHPKGCMYFRNSEKGMRDAVEVSAHRLGIMVRSANQAKSERCKARMSLHMLRKTEIGGTIEEWKEGTPIGYIMQSFACSGEVKGAMPHIAKNMQWPLFLAPIARDSKDLNPLSRTLFFLTMERDLYWIA